MIDPIMLWKLGTAIKFKSELYLLIYINKWTERIFKLNIMIITPLILYNNSDNYQNIILVTI